MDLPLAVLMEQYLAEHGAATVREFADGCRASEAACRDELPRLLAFGAEAFGHDGLRFPGTPMALAA